MRTYCMHEGKPSSPPLRFPGMRLWIGVALALWPATAVAMPPTNRVSVDLATYEALQAELRHLRKPPNAPRTFAFVGRTVEASFEQGVIRGRLVAEVEVLSDDPVDIPLLARSASLESVRINGQPSVALRDRPLPVQSSAGQTTDGYFTVRAPAPGRHAVEVRFALGRQRARFARNAVFILPPAPVTTLALTLPEPDVTVQIDGGTIRSQRSGGGGTTVHAHLGARGPFTVRWRPRVHAGTELARELETEVLARLRLADGLVDLNSTLTYRVVSGETDRVRFRVPAGLEVIRVGGPAVLQWYAEPLDKDDKAITVLLRHLVDDQASVEVQARAPRPDDHVTPRFITPLEAAFAGGFAAIEARSGYGLEVEQLDGAEEVSLRTIPEALRNASDRPFRYAFKLIRAAPQLRLKVHQNQELNLTQAVIDDIQVSSVQVEHGIEITKLSLHVRNNTRHYLHAVLPPKAELTHALIDGTPLTIAEGPDGSILIPLIQSERLGAKPRQHRIRPGDTLTQLALRYFNDTEAWQDIVNANPDLHSAYDLSVGAAIRIPRQARGLTFEESAFVIELAYKRRRPPLGRLGRRRIELPTFDVPIMSAVWHLYFPSAYDPLAVSSNLRPLTKIRYGLFNRIHQLLADANTSQRAYAGGDGYSNILLSRKAIYRKEQKRRVTEALSSFPLVGTRYRFKRVLLGNEPAFVELTYVDQRLLEPIPILAFGVFVIVAFIWAWGLGRQTVRELLASRQTVTFAAACLLFLLVGHYVLGTYRAALYGMNVGLLGALGFRLLPTAQIRLPRLSWRALLSIRTWFRLFVIAFALIVGLVILVWLPSPLLAVGLAAALIIVQITKGARRG